MSTGNGTDDPTARRAAELFAGLINLVSVVDLAPERMARWVWRQPHGEDRELLPVLWADVADWCGEVAEHLADLADATLDPSPPPTDQEEPR